MVWLILLSRGKHQYKKKSRTLENIRKHAYNWKSYSWTKQLYFLPSNGACKKTGKKRGKGDDNIFCTKKCNNNKTNCNIFIIAVEEEKKKIICVKNRKKLRTFRIYDDKNWTIPSVCFWFFFLVFFVKIKDSDILYVFLFLAECFRNHFCLWFSLFLFSPSYFGPLVM